MIVWYYKANRTSAPGTGFDKIVIPSSVLLISSERARAAYPWHHFKPWGCALRRTKEFEMIQCSIPAGPVKIRWVSSLPDATCKEMPILTS